MVKNIKDFRTAKEKMREERNNTVVNKFLSLKEMNPEVKDYRIAMAVSDEMEMNIMTVIHILQKQECYTKSR